MNIENEMGHTPLDASLRMQLRGLRRDHAPDRDLWPGIAARIAAPGAAAPVARTRRRRATHFVPWALAASVALSLGLAWKMQPPPVADTGAASMLASQVSMRREAEAMTLEYQAAFRELEAATPGQQALRAKQPALHQLDQSARQIRTALALDPGAQFLLERLRRTYSLRLELTQRASMS